MLPIITQSRPSLPHDVTHISLGARESDYPATEEVPETHRKVSSSSSVQDARSDAEVEHDSLPSSTQADGLSEDSEACIGRITFVSCVTGSEAPGPPLGDFVAPKTQIDTGMFIFLFPLQVFFFFFFFIVLFY